MSNLIRYYVQLQGTDEQNKESMEKLKKLSINKVESFEYLLKKCFVVTMSIKNEKDLHILKTMPHVKVRDNSLDILR